jgi:hypothetical protein
MNNLAEKQESAVMGLKSVMRGTPQKEATQSKSKTPVLNVSLQVQELAEKVYNDKVAMEMAENTFKQSSSELVTAVSPMRADLCQREYVSSVKVPTPSNKLVGVTWSSNYKKIPNTQEEELIKTMGSQAKYNQSFYSKFEVIAEDKTEAELYNLFCMLAPNDGETEDDVRIGQERFMNYFKVKETIRPTEQFVREHIFMSEKMKSELELCGVQQYTPSIRTR